MKMLCLYIFDSYMVLDARLLSSCFNWPSRASPRLSLLFFNNGCTVNTLDNVKPGPTGLSLEYIFLMFLVFGFGGL